MWESSRDYGRPVKLAERSDLRFRAGILTAMSFAADANACCGLCMGYEQWLHEVAEVNRLNTTCV